MKTIRTTTSRRKGAKRPRRKSAVTRVIDRRNAGHVTVSNGDNYARPGAPYRAHEDRTPSGSVDLDISTPNGCQPDRFKRGRGAAHKVQHANDTDGRSRGGVTRRFARGPAGPVRTWKPTK